MNTQRKRARQLSRRWAWEDIVDDFLEMKSGLTKNHRLKIVASLKGSGVSSKQIQPVLSFLVEDKLIHIFKNQVGYESWFFDPQKANIKVIKH